tara:strand:+ start:589 stop:834 length:246 start_codon:yes stop_codon:yes gene_type:complete
MHLYYIVGLIVVAITGFLIYKNSYDTPRERLLKSFSEKTRLANEAKIRGDEKCFKEFKYEADFFLEMIKRYDASARKDRWR